MFTLPWFYRTIPDIEFRGLNSLANDDDEFKDFFEDLPMKNHFCNKCHTEITKEKEVTALKSDEDAKMKEVEKEVPKEKVEPETKKEPESEEVKPSSRYYVYSSRYYKNANDDEIVEKVKHYEDGTGRTKTLKYRKMGDLELPELLQKYPDSDKIERKILSKDKTWDDKKLTEFENSWSKKYSTDVIFPSNNLFQIGF